MKIDRGVQFKFYLPATIHEKVRQQLYSEIEGKVPFGALSALAEELFTEWLRKQGVIV
jgi:hypothetical protein